MHDNSVQHEPAMTARLCSVCSTTCTGRCNTYEHMDVEATKPNQFDEPEAERFYLTIVDDVKVKMRVKKRESRLLFVVLSAIYCKLLVVMGVAFPLTLVISPNVPNNVYTVFYLYMYFVSIVFLIYAFTVHSKLSIKNLRRWFRRLRIFPQPKPVDRFNSRCSSVSTENNNERQADDDEDDLSEKNSTMGLGVAVDPRNCGSFYLRVGAVAFGIGSMIYSGLEFIQYLELEWECVHIVQALDPCVHLIFTFVQLYFVFINSKMTFQRHEIIARFGLMHMVATNLCVWLLAVVQESQHEIHHYTEHMRHSLKQKLQQMGDPGNNSVDDYEEHLGDISEENGHGRRKRAAVLNIIDACRNTDVFSQLVQDISPFLFPCTIEYSLICAAICYVLWKQVGKKRMRNPSDSFLDVPIRSHQYSVDCSHAIKGLFTGIFVLVLSIISVILFFVLINHEDYRNLGIQEAHISEMILSMLTAASVIIAMLKIRNFRYTHHRNVELDNILLIVGQIGIYMFSIFSIISGHLAQTGLLNNFVIFSSLSRLIQATLQTIFILDASQRVASSSSDFNRKPGREMITFLLVCNFAMWIITTLETGRHDSNSIQLNFFGFWGWTIIARISTPLAIFYRFHSTVCLCEIWKKLYKLKDQV